MYSENEIVWLYAIGCEQGPIKVGISADPHGRVLSIQTCCPFPIKLIYVRQCGTRAEGVQHEESIQECYAEYRLRGEWFNFDFHMAAEAIDMVIDTFEHFEFERRKAELQAGRVPQ